MMNKERKKNWKNIDTCWIRSILRNSKVWQNREHPFYCRQSVGWHSLLFLCCLGYWRFCLSLREILSLCKYNWLSNHFEKHCNSNFRCAKNRIEDLLWFPTTYAEVIEGGNNISVRNRFNWLRPHSQQIESWSKSDKILKSQQSKIKEETVNIKENFRFRVRFHSVWTQLNTKRGNHSALRFFQFQDTSMIH